MAKRALLVGLNSYPDPINSLRGCLNDVAQVRRLITARLGFEQSGIGIITDAAATTSAIVEGLHWLVDEAKSGDVLLFHYSGHGSQVADVHGDEADDLDEIICPYDLDWDHPFTDDDLHGIVGDLPADVSLTVILDCCHSGTGLREWPASADDRVRFLLPPEERLAPKGRGRHRFGARAAASGAILLAACQDDQVAADAAIEGDYHGAFTYYLCRALEDADCSLSYAELLGRVRRLLVRHGYDQLPQLEGPRPQLALPVFQAPAGLSVG